MQTRVAVIPDLNQDEKIAAAAQTAGAYAGALVTAVLGGLLTAASHATRGVVAGAQVTYQHAGNQAVQIPERRGPAPQGFVPYQPIQAPQGYQPMAVPQQYQPQWQSAPQPQAAPPQTLQITPEEMELIRQHRAGQQPPAQQIPVNGQVETTA